MTFESESIKYSNQLIVILKAEFYEGTEYLSNREKSIMVSSVLTHVRPDVISFGSISRSVSDIDGNFEISDISIRLDNSGGRFSAFDLERLFNADCTLTMGFINDQYADHKTIFVGSIYDYEFNNNELIISIKDYVSKKLDVKFGHYIDGDDWPNASADIVGLRMPIVYGNVYGADVVKVQDPFDNIGSYYGYYANTARVFSDGNGSTLILYNPNGTTDAYAVVSFYGNPITFSNHLLITNVAEYYNAIYDPTNDIFLVAYVDGLTGYLYCKTLSITGSTISQSSAQLIKQGSNDIVKFTYDTTNDLVIMGFKHFWEDPYTSLTISGLSGTFVEGETITGGTSGATALFHRIFSTTIYVYSVSGSFSISETVTGGTSSATATITAIGTKTIAFDFRILSIDLNSGITLNNESFINSGDFSRSDDYYFLEYDESHNFIYAIYTLYSGSNSQLEICQVSGSDIIVAGFQDDINEYIGADAGDTVRIRNATLDTTQYNLVVIFSISSNYYCSATYYDDNESNFLPAVSQYITIGDITLIDGTDLLYDDYTKAFYMPCFISGIGTHIIGARYAENIIDFSSSTPYRIGNDDTGNEGYFTIDNDKFAFTYVDDTYSYIHYFNQFIYANLYIPYPGLISSKCYCIDIINNIWLVAGHEVKSIGNIYTTDIINDQDQPKFRSDTITKTLNYSYAGGLDSKIAIIQFTTNAPTPNDIVYADCEGMIDGSSNLIENPITALEHFLVNYLGFTSADYDTTSFTSAETDSADWLLANVILPNEKYSAKELIEKWASSLGAVVGFNFDGKLIIKIMG